MNAHIRSALLMATLVLVGCGGWKRTGSSASAKIGEAPVSTVELTINNITQQQALEFTRQLDDYGDLEKIQLKSWANNTAVYEVDVDGCECDLPAMIAEIPNPGFKYQGRTTKMRFAAFDNVPPKVEFVSHKNGVVVKEKSLQLEVEVPDDDVVEVTIAGQKAERDGTRYRATVALKDGSNDIVAVAKDTTGNEGKATLRVGLDSTPPEVTGTVTVIIEGKVDPGSKVYVDGVEVPTDSAGYYEAKVKVKKGQREVQIVAVDQYGNRTETMRSIGQ
ncbi:MAG: hypothetical protein WBV82_21110 [Myxococcaceae bacterium]